jgi:hypothetical protein
METVDSILDHERIKRIIAIGNFGGIVSEDKYYVHYDYGNVKISLRPERLGLEFWVTTNHAWAPVTMPLPETMNAYVSKTMRWIFGKLLSEYLQQAS